MLHIISMFTFPSDPSSFLFWRFISSTSQKLWFLTLQNENKRFWSDFMFTKWNNTFSKRFRVTKWKNKLSKCFSCLQKEKRFNLKRFHVNEMKNTLLKHVHNIKSTFLKRFSCLQNEKRIWSVFFFFSC